MHLIFSEKSTHIEKWKVVARKKAFLSDKAFHYGIALHSSQLFILYAFFT